MKIEVHSLKKTFGKKILFDNLNLLIEPRKMTCLYGTSGCGKTTLINIIGLIERYDKGRILYDGQLVTKKRDKRKYLRNKIGFIFQDFGLLENETVGNNLKLVPRIKKLKNRDFMIDKMLNELGLEGFPQRFVYELSGGERQRVAIAKIILKDPDLILADEPTASLDDDNKWIVLKMLRQMQMKGKTIVIVSHDEQVRDYCDVSINLTEVDKQ